MVRRRPSLAAELKAIARYLGTQVRFRSALVRSTGVCEGECDEPFDELVCTSSSNGDVGSLAWVCAVWSE